MDIMDTILSCLMIENEPKEMPFRLGRNTNRESWHKAFVCCGLVQDRHMRQGITLLKILLKDSGKTLFEVYLKIFKHYV